VLERPENGKVIGSTPIFSTKVPTEVGISKGSCQFIEGLPERSPISLEIATFIDILKKDT
jgi:hypothetical protein